MPLLITPEALAQDDECIVFDCRFSLIDPNAGRRQYEAAHIPGARYTDLERDLSARPGQGGRHPLPDREDLAERLRDFGICRDSRIVCYDQNTGAVAGRLWWLLRWLGHGEVALLDGGLDAWIAAGLPADANPVATIPGDFEAGPALTRSCPASACLRDDVVLIDAREATRYRGEAEPIDTVAGHIPGAISAPFAENLADGRFRSPEALRERFQSLGIDGSSDLICYCGSGVTATHNIIALLLAGFPEPILYPGSWSEWIADPERPRATG
jgi:thiosulfate/3-mercaptopyruvate sulfurtransferase